MGFKSVCVLPCLYWFKLSQLFWVIHWYFIILHAIHAVGSLQIGRSILKVFQTNCNLYQIGEGSYLGKMLSVKSLATPCSKLASKTCIPPPGPPGLMFPSFVPSFMVLTSFWQTSDARTIWAFSMLVFLFFWEQMLKRGTWAIKISFYIAFQLLSVCMFYHVDWNMI